MTDYPYVLGNSKLTDFITKIQQAAKPTKLTQEMLKSLGFTSTNDRGFIVLLKKLGFLNEDGTPTALYDQLKDTTCAKKVLAVQIKELYSELFAINTEINKATDVEIKGAISRVTGRDEAGVSKIYNTFKALCNLADFDASIPAPVKEEEEKVDSAQTSVPIEQIVQRSNEFHYNIQIHLPATTDISVYNAIFKSLKDNLLI